MSVVIQKFRNWLREGDNAVSPVIGTVLMVAVTVVLGAAVYAAMSGFGDKSMKESPHAAFKVQALDTDSDGKSDHLKVTYITGPKDVPVTDVTVLVKFSVDGSSVSPVSAKTTPWNAGDFLIYNPGQAATLFVTVNILGTAVVDQSVTVDE